MFAVVEADTRNQGVEEGWDVAHDHVCLRHQWTQTVTVLHIDEMVRASLSVLLCQGLGLVPPGLAQAELADV